MNKKNALPLEEVLYLIACLLCAAGITLQTRADIGISMIAAPAYLISLKFPAITFGMAECLLQGTLFLSCCLLTRSFLVKRLWSFVAAVPYGWLLDRVMEGLGWVSPETFGGRVLVFLLGCSLVSAGVALFIHSYLPCQVYEMFVQCISDHFRKPFSKVKLIFDWSCLAVALVFSVLFFRHLEGIGLGTILCTLLNAPLIGVFGKLLDRFFTFRPAFPKLTKYF